MQTIPFFFEISQQFGTKVAFTFGILRRKKYSAKFKDFPFHKKTVLKHLETLSLAGYLNFEKSWGEITYSFRRKIKLDYTVVSNYDIKEILFMTILQNQKYGQDLQQLGKLSITELAKKLNLSYEYVDTNLNFLKSKGLIFFEKLKTANNKTLKLIRVSDKFLSETLQKANNFFIKKFSSLPPKTIQTGQKSGKFFNKTTAKSGKFFNKYWEAEIPQVFENQLIAPFRQYKIKNINNINIKNKYLILNISPFKEKDLPDERKIEDLTFEELIRVSFLEEFNRVLGYSEEKKSRSVDLKFLLKNAKAFVKKFGEFTIGDLRRAAREIVNIYFELKRLYPLRSFSVQLLMHPKNYDKLQSILRLKTKRVIRPW